MSKSFTNRLLPVVTFCIAGGLVLGTVATRADDAQGTQRREAARMANVAKMKQVMADPANMPAMSSNMVRMQAMTEMATDLAKDPECKAMCDQMMASDAGKSMMATPAMIDAAKAEIMKDPEAMKMVAAQSMMMNMSSHSDMKMGGDMKPMMAPDSKPMMSPDMKK